MAQLTTMQEKTWKTRKRRKQKKNGSNACVAFDTAGSTDVLPAKHKPRGSSDRHSAIMVHYANAKNAKNVIRSKISRFGTWNVWTLHQTGKLDNALQGMNRMKIDGLSSCETSGLTRENSIKAANKEYFIEEARNIHTEWV